MTAAGVLESIRSKKKALSSQVWHIKPYETKEYILQSERRSQQIWRDELKSGGKYATLWHQDCKFTMYIFYVLYTYYNHIHVCTSMICRSAYTIYAHVYIYIYIYIYIAILSSYQWRPLRVNDPADAPLSSTQPERVVFGVEDLKPHLTALRLCMRDRPRSYQQGIRARYVIVS